jgi:hypothetical protein
MQARVRRCHKTHNVQLKNWGFSSQVLRHDIMKHGDVFGG